ncbi:Imm45 family immunity protein [Pseudomonas panipatensis]|uniref:Imm45 family immunity protein n=1 Tax=Pseudomonas panipatensis TaxID=428992 RepID=UPI000B7C96F8|nr:Imm45 family immunity protein [Pseudomonas panipatensis]
MVSKVRLVDYKESSIWHGNVLRACGKYPYEEFVDFMVFETQSEDTPYGLIVTSGYKAGLILVCLPKESSSVAGGVDKEWIVSNWERWIYPDCDVSDVYLIDRYECPVHAPKPTSPS